MIRTETHVYDGPGGPFEGTVSWDDERGQFLPGVLVAHAYGGQSQFETDKAIALARQGYVGFAIDVYGQGRRASSPAEAQALMDQLNGDRQLLSDRMNSALQALLSIRQVDKTRTAAIGFCFGGKCALDLARSGAPIKGVVSFHGLYDPPNLGHEGEVQAAVLVLHGWDDPLSPPEHVLELAEELNRREVDWQLISYGHTGHSFTNPRAQAVSDGMYYHPASDQRSWVAMQAFLTELFGGQERAEAGYDGCPQVELGAVPHH